MIKDIEEKNQQKPAEMTDEVREEIKDSGTWFKDHEQEVLDVEKLEKNDAIETFKQKNGYEPSTAELNKFMAELGPNVLDREV